MNKELIEQLKENNQDYELYPTNKRMIRTIFEHMDKDYVSVLDIGCGTCNFKKYFEELAEELYNIEFKQSEKKLEEYYENKIKEWESENNKKYDRIHGYISKGTPSARKKKISNYFVIEKSKILIDRLDKDTMVLGTDFHNTLLLDKPVSTVFCNPPYSEFKEWMYKIIEEANCYNIYLIVPTRWKDDKKIESLLKRKELKVNILETTDFLDAERKARANVDILYIKKNDKYNRYNSNLKDVEEDAFLDWFNKTFEVKDKSDEEKKLYEWEVKNNKEREIKNNLVPGQDKAEQLVTIYNTEMKKLFDNFKAICSLDIDVLETMGIDKEKIMNTIKDKTKNLKLLYWGIVFSELETITDRLTKKTRDRLFDKFKQFHTIDFTPSNIYAVLIWIIKNSNKYYNEQLVDFYKEMSSFDNCSMYKSNQKVFNRDDWRYRRIEESGLKYTLDYRIVCSNYLFGVEKDYSGDIRDYRHGETLRDIKAIFGNLGFEIRNIEQATRFGEKYYAMDYEGKTLFEYKCYKNGNLHIKFNLEFTKALNVEVSRLLGWIRTAEDIKKEFPDELAKGAEKYFKTNCALSIENTGNLLGYEKED